MRKCAMREIKFAQKIQIYSQLETQGHMTTHPATTKYKHRKSKYELKSFVT